MANVRQVAVQELRALEKNNCAILSSLFISKLLMFDRLLMDAELSLKVNNNKIEP
jgi:hypothetical protein